MSPQEAPDKLKHDVIITPEKNYIDGLPPELKILILTVNYTNGLILQFLNEPVLSKMARTSKTWLFISILTNKALTF